MPRPAEVGGDDRQLGEARGDGVEMDWPSWVELDPLATRLPGADPAGAGVEKTGDLELRGFFPEPEMAIVAGIEVLHRGVEFGSPGTEFGDGSRGLLGGRRFPRIARSQEEKPSRVPFGVAVPESGATLRPA